MTILTKPNQTVFQLIFRFRILKLETVLPGRWELIPLEMPPGCCVQEASIAFKEVNITGKVMVFTGGPNGQSQRQPLSLHRTPEGTLYMDTKGSVLTEFSPEMGIIKFQNALGYGGMFKRHAAVVTAQPGVGFGVEGALPPPPPYHSVGTEKSVFYQI